MQKMEGSTSFKTDKAFRSQTPSKLTLGLPLGSRAILREPVHKEDELFSLKRSIEEFSIRLDFILNCIATPSNCLTEVKVLNQELVEFVESFCIGKTPVSRGSDSNLMGRLIETEERLSFLLEDHEKLRESLSNSKRSSPADRNLACRTITPEDPEEEASNIRLRIDMMKQDLIEKHIIIEEMRRSHESQLRKLDSVNREEVNLLREAVAALTQNIDNWKNIYTDDISRLREELNEKNRRLESLSPRKISTLSKPKSCDKI
jgi:hypothetical protein